jgi:hypothetical protein
MKNAQAFEDGIYMIVIVFALAIGAIVITYSYNEIYDQFNSTAAFNTTEVMASFDAGRTVNNMWDWLILVVVFGFAISVVIIGYFIDAHTIFFPLYLIGMMVGLAFAVIIDYVWDKVFADTVFVTLATSFPITNHILSNMTIYYFIIASLSMFAMFAKTRVEVA